MEEYPTLGGNNEGKTDDGTFESDNEHESESDSDDNNSNLPKIFDGQLVPSTTEWGADDWGTPGKNTQEVASETETSNNESTNTAMVVLFESKSKK